MMPGLRSSRRITCIVPSRVPHFAPASKPLTTGVADADELVRLAAETSRIFAVTYNSSGYPMVRQARAMVARGDIGALRVLQVE